MEPQKIFLSCGKDIFILRKLQEKYLAKKKNLDFTFVDLEKPFDQVHRDVAWWVLRRLVAEGWLVKIAQLVYSLL